MIKEKHQPSSTTWHSIIFCKNVGSWQHNAQNQLFFVTFSHDNCEVEQSLVGFGLNINIRRTRKMSLDKNKSSRLLFKEKHQASSTVSG